jgi:hypothetical protein
MAGTIKYFNMRMNSIPLRKEILLFCHPTAAPGADLGGRGVLGVYTPLK